MARRRKKEASQGIACYLCHDGAIADTPITLGNLICCGGTFPNKLFTIEPLGELPTWMNTGLVAFKERGAYAEFLDDGQRTTNVSLTLHSFGDRIGYTVIVCKRCCAEYVEKQDLYNALHVEFDRRLTQLYERLCRGLFDRGLLRFDVEALEKFMKEHGPSITCQEWFATIQEITDVGQLEHIKEMQERLAPILAASIRSGESAIRAA